MLLVSLSLHICNSGFVRLTAVYAEDERIQRKVAFFFFYNQHLSVHSDDVQDSHEFGFVYSICRDCLYSYILLYSSLLQCNTAFKTPGPRVPIPHVPGLVFLVSHL